MNQQTHGLVIEGGYVKVLYTPKYNREGYGSLLNTKRSHSSCPKGLTEIEKSKHD